MTIDERIQALTLNLELESRMRQDAELRHEARLEGHDRKVTDHEKWLQRHEATMQRIDRRLDRAIRLGIREARQERKRRQELEALVTARHLELQALLKAFLERGGNGHA